MNKIIRISFSGLLFIVLGLFVLSTGSAKAANLPGCYGADKKTTNCDVNGVDQAGNNLSTLDKNGNTLSSQNCYVVTSKADVSPVVYNQVQCSDLTTVITPTAAPNQDPNVVCANSGGAMAWVVCPVIEAIGHGEELFINMINTQLKTKPVNLTSKTDPVTEMTKRIWTNFRFIGNLVLVIAVLVIVYAEAVGGSIADAYTVQKTLPRILITAMLINLSIYLMLGLQDIFNVLGSGISDLILQPFKSAGGGGLINISAGTGALFTAGSVGLGLIGVAALTSGIVPILLLLGLSGLLALTGVFVTVILRQGILFVLVVTSPVAFALYCLPNTEQYFKKWWNFSIKILMVYPIVNVVIALAYVSGFVMSQINGGTGGQLLAAIASMLPLFLIPFAFKMSGGAMASIYGAVSGVTNRLRKPINKLAGNIAKKKAAENYENLKAGNYFKGGIEEGNRRGAFNRRLQRATFAAKGGATLNRDKRKARVDQAVNDYKEHNLEEVLKQNPEIQTIMGNGEFSKLAMESTGADDLTNKLLQTSTYQEMRNNRIRELTSRGVSQQEAENQADAFVRNDAQNRSQRFSTVRRKIGDSAFKEVMSQSYFSDKNAPKDVEDALQVMAGMANHLGSDPASQEAYIMKVSSMMDKVGRVDFSAASAGTKLGEGMKIIAAVKNGASAADLKNMISQSAETIRKSSLEGTSSSKAMMQASPRALEQLADQQNRNIGGLRQQMSTTTNPDEMASLQREFKRQYAAMAANYDALASGDPAHAKIYADRIMGQSATNQLYQLPDNLNPKNVPMNNQQMIDTLRNDPEFLQFRREYANQRDADRGAPITPPQS